MIYIYIYIERERYKQTNMSDFTQDYQNLPESYAKMPTRAAESAEKGI